MSLKTGVSQVLPASVCNGDAVQVSETDGATKSSRCHSYGRDDGLLGPAQRVRVAQRVDLIPPRPAALDPGALGPSDDARRLLEDQGVRRRRRWGRGARHRSAALEGDGERQQELHVAVVVGEQELHVRRRGLRHHDGQGRGVDRHGQRVVRPVVRVGVVREVRACVRGLPGDGEREVGAHAGRPEAGVVAVREAGARDGGARVERGSEGRARVEGRVAAAEGVQGRGLHRGAASEDEVARVVEHERRGRVGIHGAGAGRAQQLQPQGRAEQHLQQLPPPPPLKSGLSTVDPGGDSSSRHCTSAPITPEAGALWPSAGGCSGPGRSEQRALRSWQSAGGQFGPRRFDSAVAQYGGQRGTTTCRQGQLLADDAQSPHAHRHRPPRCRAGRPAGRQVRARCCLRPHPHGPPPQRRALGQRLTPAGPGAG
eukprot:COSAG04_NODE_1543_length_6408_cov_131.251862_4_plen_427_part_00